MIGIDAALRKTLVAYRRPVLTEYELFQLLRRLITDQALADGTPIRQNRSSQAADRNNFRLRVRSLLKGRYARPDNDFYPGVNDGTAGFLRTYHYKVLRISDLPDGAAEDISAVVDPFCYLSHLSAMQRYGLTNRNPAGLVISSPSPKLWRQLRDEKIAKDLKMSGRLAEGSDPIVPLERIDLPDVLRGRTIDRHTTKHLTPLRPIRGSQARIPEIGEVFMQMLERPELCGGIHHVIEVWASEAVTYKEEIIAATEQREESILKVRSGYLLEVLAGVKDTRVDAWQKFAQRGGSRKLDASAPYFAQFSEKWMISLNVESEYLPSPR